MATTQVSYPLPVLAKTSPIIISKLLMESNSTGSLSPERVYDLIACRKCDGVLQNPVTTQCGLSYCRTCLLDSSGYGACLEDQCREYDQADCQVDLTTQYVITQLTRILEDGKEKRISVDLLSEIQKSLEDDLVMKCSICLERFLNPVTTQCGHTFCENCVRWLVETTSIEDTIHCPICRSTMNWPYQQGFAHHHDAMETWSNNKFLIDLIWTCWAPWVQKKSSMLENQEHLVSLDHDIAIFVCTASWPGQHTLLRIFEPRYRRMLRRIMKTPTRAFGMIMRNPDGTTDESRVGTLLHVDKIVHGEDQSIYIQTTGVSRFRVLDGARIRDGYWTASIEPLFDDNYVDWEHQEIIPTVEQSRRISLSASTLTSMNVLAAIKLYQDNPELVRCLTSTEIVAVVREYINMRLEHHSLEVRRMVFAQLREPPEDNIDLIWWFAHVMGIRGEFAVRLLGSGSVRFRLESSLWYIVSHIPDHYARLWNLE